MESPVARTTAHGHDAGWTARQQNGVAPRTVERRRRGRGADVIALPTPPQNRQNTHLPTPETIRHPRIRKPDNNNDSSKAASKDHLSKYDTQTETRSFLPTPQTLPRKRSAAVTGVYEPTAPSSAEPPSPSGQTTFIHSHAAGQVSGGERSVRRRPGLTFAQQMGLLSTTVSGGGGGAGNGVGIAGVIRQGPGVGMGGGHKHAAGTGGHRGVDMIIGYGKAKDVAEEENPFYVPPSSRKIHISAKASTRPSPRNTAPIVSADIDMAVQSDDEELFDTEDDMPGPSSPLAGRSPGILHSPANLTLPKQPSFATIPTSTHSSKSLITPTTPKASSSTLPHSHTLPPAFAGSTPRRSPRQLAKAARLAAMRDEDHNPFLARPGDIHRAIPALPGMEEGERRFVNYVFRGQKKTFINPFYPHDAPFPPANLPLEHPDYEDHPCPPPKLLWPTAPMVDKSQSTTVAGADVVEVTPSPPSSPIMRTPKTNHLTRGRFVNADRSLTGDMFDPPAEVYTDSEDERERVRGNTVAAVGVSRKARGAARRGEIKVAVGRDSDEEDEGVDEDEVPVRRGLLFGAGASASASINGAKRAAEEDLVDADAVQSKRARTLRV